MGIWHEMASISTNHYGDEMRSHYSPSSHFKCETTPFSWTVLVNAHTTIQEAWTQFKISRRRKKKTMKKQKKKRWRKKKYGKSRTTQNTLQSGWWQSKAEWKNVERSEKIETTLLIWALETIKVHRSMRSPFLNDPLFFTIKLSCCFFFFILI